MISVKVFIDIPKDVPPHHEIADVRRQLVDMFTLSQVELVDNAFEAVYVIKVLGSKNDVAPERQIIVRDFSFPQTVPRGATCLDLKKKVIVKFNPETSEVTHIPLEYYVLEFLDINFDDEL